MEPVFTTASYFLYMIVALLAGVAYLWETYHDDRKGSKGKESLENPPSPMSLPVLGHLHLLAGYEIPMEGFNNIRKKYGDIVKLQLGSVPCVLVSGIETIREVLIKKAEHFDGRPGFKRYHQLFGGDKENSLAFCDYSDVQRVRRDILKTHMFPRAFSSRFNHLDNFTSSELESLLQHLDNNTGKPLHFKNELLFTMANIFTSYFCSTKYEWNDPNFQLMVKSFDEIFYEVNQGCLADFFPWLAPMYSRHLSTIASWGEDIRTFMMKTIIDPRKESFSAGEEDPDLVGSMVDYIDNKKNTTLTWEHALFALEDILGGHSAIGNFIMLVLAYIVKRPDIKSRIAEEALSATGNIRLVSLADREKMSFTEATILEAVRSISSPIVPHYSNQDSTIGGYQIEKGTMVFINNYDLNKGADYWEEPQTFDPERFIANKDEIKQDDNNNDVKLADGCIKKPDYFIPFSTGRRSCMGYKMLQYVSFLTVSNILQKFDILPVDGENYDLTPCSLAVPSETFKLTFQKR